MEAIYIPRLLKLSERKEEVTIQESIAGLNTLTPIRGLMVIKHGGNYLEVVAKAETIVTLVCDRCLNHYNHRISINTSELIWLEAEQSEDFPQEREVAVEDLSETLSPDGYFEPETWLYEQLSLAMPLRQLCGKTCQGTEVTPSVASSGIDSRWASLADLKKQLSTNNE
ncbi:protein of unknown function DUF177 [Stanieria cyanosphaera PCC 7437]|uniref:Metal-binding protein n=1 Tax=Stanieria cyanosphaera (strain ATCC 29371 / PCC 7437) TaxID=111780 RepID=K9XTU7_STAC7|nr:YceD family protein [Stanieria cyanosphaera]AFZ36030.1 protein of unknown function DUF177 [Stanieria cyanosphaera PCC 7437]